MAASRERRNNAGNKMSSLLEQEEQDDFYQTTYGGFNEQEDDNDYTQAQEEPDDLVDSDFSIDEDDQPVSDGEHDKDDNKTRKKKVYAAKSVQDKDREKKRNERNKARDAGTPREKNRNRDRNRDRDGTARDRDTRRETHKREEDQSFTRKSVRKSTAVNSAELNKKLKVRSELEMERIKSKKPVKQAKPPTQQELLAEAEITEKENLESLAKYRALEKEKKIMRPTKRLISGPTIKYHSYKIKVLESDKRECSPKKIITESIISDGPEYVPFVRDCLTSFQKKAIVEKDIDIDDGLEDVKVEYKIENLKDLIDKEKADESSNVEIDMQVDEKPVISLEDPPVRPNDKNEHFQERTVISFGNDVHNSAFNNAFPKHRLPTTRRKICAVTKQLARYKDPVTGLAYSSLEAFKILREAYHQLLLKRGDRSKPEVAKWLSHYEL